MTRPTVIALNNSFDVTVEGAAVDGTLRDDLALRAYIAATRTATTAINAALAVDLTPVGGGSGNYVGSIPGTSLATHLGSKLHDVVYLVAESNPVGSYRDVLALFVTEDQSA